MVFPQRLIKGGFLIGTFLPLPDDEGAGDLIVPSRELFGVTTWYNN